MAEAEATLMESTFFIGIETRFTSKSSIDGKMPSCSFPKIRQTFEARFNSRMVMVADGSAAIISKPSFCRIFRVMKSSDVEYSGKRKTQTIENLITLKQ